MQSPTSLTGPSFLLAHEPLSPTDLNSGSTSALTNTRSNMELKMRECERETKEDCIHTILFTAGTFLLMVYLKSFLVEQWRAWVFLILNVILLAILFMSMRPVSWDRSAESESDVEEVKDDDKEKIRPCVCSSQEIIEGKECYEDVNVLQSETEEDEEEEEEEQVPMLSKEELNAKVEAFIAMFRQHLISDVKQAEDFRLNKPANLTPKIEVPCC